MVECLVKSWAAAKVSKAFQKTTLAKILVRSFEGKEYHVAHGLGGGYADTQPGGEHGQLDGIASA